MSVNSYLESLGSRLVLSDAEKSSIKTSVDSIRRRLTGYLDGLNEIKIYGSYSRDTILPRKVDENSDVDIMVVFTNSACYKPQSFLDKLRRFAECYYSSSEIHQSSPSLVLELNHIKFELTPAYKLYSSYYIPYGPSEWQRTDPDGLAEALLNCNKLNDFRIKPIVRLLKLWNIKKNSGRLASFSLEKEIGENLKFAFLDCKTYLDYVKKGFETLRSVTDDGKIDDALYAIRATEFFESKVFPVDALREIKKVFPEI